MYKLVFTVRFIIFLTGCLLIQCFLTRNEPFCVFHLFLTISPFLLLFFHTMMSICSAFSFPPISSLSPSLQVHSLTWRYSCTRSKCLSVPCSGDHFSMRELQWCMQAGNLLSCGEGVGGWSQCPSLAHK